MSPPGPIMSESPFSLVAAAEDTFGNVDPTYNGQVTVALANHPGGAHLGGTTSVTAANGVATFSDLTLDKAGAGATIAIASAGLAGTTAGPVAVAAGTVTQLVVAVGPPAGVPVGAPFGLVVAAADPFGNVDPTFQGDVTLALSRNPLGAHVGGTATVAAINGLATFSGLSVDKASTGDTLAATTTGAGVAATATRPFRVEGPEPLTVFQPSTSTFYIAGVGATPFGQGTLYGGDPIPIVADIAGTGHPQLIVFQPSTSSFFVQGVGITQFGQGTLYGGPPVPLVADVAGLGHPQLIVFQPSTSTFYVQGVGAFQFGQGALYGGDPVPLAADFNLDGKDDLTVFQPSTSTFYVRGIGATPFGQGTLYGGDPHPVNYGSGDPVLASTSATAGIQIASTAGAAPVRALAGAPDVALSPLSYNGPAIVLGTLPPPAAPSRTLVDPGPQRHAIDAAIDVLWAAS